MWRSVFSHTNSSDTDGFEELDRYYLEPDGFFLPISNSRDEQSEVPKTSVSVNTYENEHATTSELDEVPKTSVYINNFEHEEPPTSENYNTDLFNDVLPESSDMNKSEENEQNADQGSFQREDKETFFPEFKQIFQLCLPLLQLQLSLWGEESFLSPGTFLILVEQHLPHLPHPLVKRKSHPPLKQLRFLHRVFL